MIEIHSHTQANVAGFPRVYRPAGGWRAFLLTICLLLGGFAAAGIVYFGTGHETNGTRDMIMLVSICVAFVLLSVGLAAWIFVARVTLWPDRIEARDLIKTRTLLLDDIVGRRVIEQQNGPPYLVLVPRYGKQMKIAKMYKFDAIFQQWIGSLPDLDAQDVRAVELEIASNEEIGATPDDRLDALKRGKRLSTLLTVATFAVCGWAWFYPVPYRGAVAVLAVLPWVAVAITARSGSLFRIDSKKKDPHPSVGIAFLMPGLILTLRVLADMNWLHWKGPLYLSIAIGLLLGIAAILADTSLRQSRVTALILVVLSASYGFGVGMEANALLDHTPRSLYRVRVTDKHISSGRHTTYDLYLAPWGPKEDNDRVSVSRKFYNSVQPGDNVCLLLHQGALHIPWYTVHYCPDSSRRAGQ